MIKYLARRIGRMDIGHPVEVLGPVDNSTKHFNCVLAGEERILFADEIANVMADDYSHPLDNTRK